jgi:cytoskeleton protein RodZ
MSEETLAPLTVGEEPLAVASELSAASVVFAASSEVARGVGEQLRSAREAKKMTVADVAQALKFSVHQVVALEANDWSHLPGNTIIRGFVRNYARLLKLDAAPLMRILDMEHMPQLPKLEFAVDAHEPLPKIGALERPDFAALFSGLALVVFALLVYFFVPQNFWQSTLSGFGAGKKVVETETADKTAEPLSAVPSASVTHLALTSSATLSPVTDMLPVELGSTVAPAMQNQVSASADTGSGLKLSFAQASWVEVRERSGQVVFAQLNPAGSRREIEGQPPFALTIGNATHVTVQYKGKIVDLPPRSKDDVARLTLE